MLGSLKGIRAFPVLAALLVAAVDCLTTGTPVPLGTLIKLGLPPLTVLGLPFKVKDSPLTLDVLLLLLSCSLLNFFSTSLNLFSSSFFPSFSLSFNNCD